MEPYSIILMAYLETAQCMGIDHPKSDPPMITYVSGRKFKCFLRKGCSGLYRRRPRRIKIAGDSSTMALLRHEMVHDLLMQRDGSIDKMHKDPAFRECLGR